MDIIIKDKYNIKTYYFSNVYYNKLLLQFFKYLIITNSSENIFL